MLEWALLKFLDIISLTKLTVSSENFMIIGAFVFDIDVNDAVRILKKDSASDIRSFV